MLRTLLAAALLTSPALAAPPIAPRLARGVNLSHWWSRPFERDKPPEQIVTDADLAEIKRAGFTHVRIPVDPALLSDGSAL
ncbi:MAG: glycoside hydrolase, partial [Thermoleophilia bacterium]|nr:glycoside hydrolase [Thermoleophilia bacterium]